jgi:transitional endoplasmic reticulum ATPase
MIQVHTCPDIPNATRIHILPFADTISGVDTLNLTRNLVFPYFKDCFRPVHKGDSFLVRGNFLAIEYKIVATEPADSCIVTADTVIFDQGDPI